MYFSYSYSEKLRKYAFFQSEKALFYVFTLKKCVFTQFFRVKVPLSLFTFHLFCPILHPVLSRNRGLFFKKVYGWLVLSKSQEGCNLLIFKRRFKNHDVI